MIVKLNSDQFTYLVKCIFADHEIQQLTITVKKENRLIFLEVDSDTADNIRDWANQKLQKNGFDANYRLTNEGRLLNDFVDMLYIE